MENITRLKKNFNKGGFDIGAPLLKLWTWYIVSICLFESGILPFSNVLVLILRTYGAKIGKDVRIKPGIRVTYPWKLYVGDHSWLASCNIDNLEMVVIGKNVCISQQAMILTGNHNYQSSTFDLMAKPIIIEDGAWIGARALVCPGVLVSTHAVLTAGSIATRNMESYMIYQGNPAVEVRKRRVL